MNRQTQKKSVSCSLLISLGLISFRKGVCNATKLSPILLEHKVIYSIHYPKRPYRSSQRINSSSHLRSQRISGPADLAARVLLVFFLLLVLLADSSKVFRMLTNRCPFLVGQFSRLSLVYPPTDLCDCAHKGCV